MATPTVRQILLILLIAATVIWMLYLMFLGFIVVMGYGKPHPDDHMSVEGHNFLMLSIGAGGACCSGVFYAAIVTVLGVLYFKIKP